KRPSRRKSRTSAGRTSQAQEGERSEELPKANAQPEPAPATLQAEKHARPSDGATFPIVGIGASAGGLEALEVFLRHVPGKSGVAFVVVEHLDPTHKGMLVELLQRLTSMPVLQAKDSLKAEPDHVYVIPPNKDLSILHGTLHLLPQ